MEAKLETGDAENVRTSTSIQKSLVEKVEGFYRFPKFHFQESFLQHTVLISIFITVYIQHVIPFLSFTLQIHGLAEAGGYVAASKEVIAQLRRVAWGSPRAMVATFFGHLFIYRLVMVR